MIGYRLLASPTLHAGQDLRAAVQLSDDATGPVEARLIVAHYTGAGRARLAARASGDIAARRSSSNWAGGYRRPAASRSPRSASKSRARRRAPSTWIGCRGRVRRTCGSVGPSTVERCGAGRGSRPWTSGRLGKPETYRFSQNRGTGLISQGSLDWTDYRVEADVTPWMAAAAGVAARVQGLRRYYALLAHQRRAGARRSGQRRRHGPVGRPVRHRLLPDVRAGARGGRIPDQSLGRWRTARPTSTTNRRERFVAVRSDWCARRARWGVTRSGSLPWRRRSNRGTPERTELEEARS